MSLFGLLYLSQVSALQANLTTQQEIESCFVSAVSAAQDPVNQGIPQRVVCEVGAVEIELSNTLTIPILGDLSETILLCNGTRFVPANAAADFTMLEVDGSMHTSNIHDWDVTVEGCDIDGLTGSLNSVGINYKNPLKQNGGRIHLKDVHIGNNFSFNDAGDTAIAATENIAPFYITISDSMLESAGTIIDASNDADSRIQITNSVITGAYGINDNPCMIVGLGSVESKNNIWSLCDYIELQSVIASFYDTFTMFGQAKYAATPNSPWFRIGDVDSPHVSNTTINSTIRLDALGQNNESFSKFIEINDIQSLNANLIFTSANYFGLGCPAMFKSDGVLVDASDAFRSVGAINIQYSAPTLSNVGHCDDIQQIGTNLLSSIKQSSLRVFGEIKGKKRGVSISDGEIYTQNHYNGTKECINLGNLDSVINNKPVFIFENSSTLIRYSCSTTQGTHPGITLKGTFVNEVLDCAESGFKNVIGNNTISAGETLYIDSTAGSIDGETIVCFVYDGD